MKSNRKNYLKRKKFNIFCPVTTRQLEHFYLVFGVVVSTGCYIGLGAVVYYFGIFMKGVL